MGAFLVLHVAIPALRRLCRLPGRTSLVTPHEPGVAAAHATAAILLGVFVALSLGGKVARAADGKNK